MRDYIISCLQAAQTAWGDLVSTARTHRRLMYFGFAVCSVSSMACTALNPDDALEDLPVALFATAMPEAVLLTPLLIATHRFIILDTAEPASWISRRSLHFFSVWAVLIILLFGPISTAQRWLVSDDAAIASILLLAPGILASLWVTLIFPAIAVDAPAPCVKNALADIDAHVWRIFWVGTFACAPIIASSLAISFAQDALMEATGLASQDLRLASAPLEGLLGLALYVLLAVIASRFFLAVGNRLKQPARET